jgi:hypothetical protein
VYNFHANIFAMPTDDVAHQPLALRSESLTKLTQPSGKPLTLTAPLPVTWEYAAEHLAALPRMIFEPDGSFVWSGDFEGRRWQVDGHLFEFHFDNEPKLHRLELHGECPVDIFDTLLKCVDWPASQIVFELVMEGVALDEANFRQWAAADSV